MIDLRESNSVNQSLNRDLVYLPSFSSGRVSNIRWFSLPLRQSSNHTVCIKPAEIVESHRYIDSLCSTQPFPSLPMEFNTDINMPVEMYRIRPVDLYRIRHVDMYRIRPVYLYRIRHVDLYRMRHVDMYRMRHVDLYRMRHVDLYYMRRVYLYRMRFVEMYRMRPRDLYRMRPV